MPERQRLPKLREKDKLIEIKNQINGITEELLNENETDTININHLIQSAATVTIETITEPGKTLIKRKI